MAPYEALYGGAMSISDLLTEMGERTTTGPKLVRDTYEKVDFI